MGATIYYAVINTAFLFSTAQALNLSIPFVRTNSVENLVADLQSLQRDLNMWSDIIPSADESYNHVQEVIEAAAYESNGIFGGNSIPSDDLVGAAEYIYNTLAAFEPPTGKKDPSEFNYLAHDPFYGIDLSAVFDYIRDWKPSDENPFPPPDPRLSSPEMRAIIAEVKEREQAEEYYRRQQQEQTMRDLLRQYYTQYPDQMQNNQVDNNGYDDGTAAAGIYDFQDMFSAALTGGPSILDHNVGPLDFAYQPYNSPSGAMEEEIDDSITTSAPLNSNTALNGQFNTAFNGPFDIVQSNRVNAFNGPLDMMQGNQANAFNWPLDTVSIPQVNAVSNTPIDTAYKSLGQFDRVDIASTGGANTQADTGPAHTTSTGSLGALARGIPAGGTPWSSFDSNAPPPTQPFKARQDRNAVRRNRKAALAAGVNPNYESTNADVGNRKIRTLKKDDGTQTQGDNSQDNMNSNSKRRLQLNFKA
ncbi:hypothetical protein TWF788_007544 [Orbilia oligospora]|uniref:Uncharacterized protein n=1 Tax=Orbilia oligospora TaxID=2813651 RepID=A0A7C8U2U4_ORBOL|nr:hypothetical protein TWF788_007544 [Orbilia oligospora]